jgi:hypothetical protein
MDHSWQSTTCDKFTSDRFTLQDISTWNAPASSIIYHSANSHLLSEKSFTGLFPRTAEEESKQSWDAYDQAEKEAAAVSRRRKEAEKPLETVAKYAVTELERTYNRQEQPWADGWNDVFSKILRSVKPMPPTILYMIRHHPDGIRTVEAFHEEELRVLGIRYQGEWARVTINIHSFPFNEAMRYVWRVKRVLRMFCETRHDLMVFFTPEQALTPNVFTYPKRYGQEEYPDMWDDSHSGAITRISIPSVLDDQ